MTSPPRPTAPAVRALSRAATGPVSPRPRPAASRVRSRVAPPGRRPPAATARSARPRRREAPLRAVRSPWASAPGPSSGVGPWAGSFSGPAPLPETPSGSRRIASTPDSNAHHRNRDALRPPCGRPSPDRSPIPSRTGRRRPPSVRPAGRESRTGRPSRGGDPGGHPRPEAAGSHPLPAARPGAGRAGSPPVPAAPSAAPPWCRGLRPPRTAPRGASRGTRRPSTPSRSDGATHRPGGAVR